MTQERVAPAIDQTIRPYASTKDSARLPDGRTIHLVCIGRGSPVVLLTAGGSGWSVSWAKVQPGAATKTRVCSWDPAGLGLSSPSSKPQTSDNMTSDLQAALKARHINGPHVVVGHSLGAYVSLLLADRRPSSVVGMVLVDPSIPDQTAIFERITPAQTAWMKAQPGPVPFLENCAAALRSGAVRPGHDPNGCLRAPDWPPSWPPEFRAALNKDFVGASPAATAAAIATIASNMESTDQDAKVVINSERNYGSMPLIVLTASEFRSPRNYPAAAKAELGDASHRRVDRRDADARKTRALESAGIPIMRWEVGRLPDAVAIRAAVAELAHESHPASRASRRPSLPGRAEPRMS